MARISTYSQDASVAKNDKLIGSDAGGDTRNFTLESIADFLNTSSLINVNGQLIYKYETATHPDNGEFTFVGGGGNQTLFSAVTSLQFSYFNTNDQNIAQYLQYFDGLFVMLTETTNPNNFGQFAISSITDTGEGATYATFGLSFREGNGRLSEYKHYAMSFSPKGQSDKNFVSPNINFVANQAQTINHNLAKFPSVTTVDSAGSHVVGDIQHTNNNTFTITFKSSFQGKVYVN